VYYGRQLGAAVGCTEASSLAACLTAVPVERIYEHAAMFSECSIRGDMNLEKPNPWAPTVDGFAEEAFVPASSEQLLRQGQVNPRISEMFNFCEIFSSLLLERISVIVHIMGRASEYLKG
jgi:hypothetical protein